MALNNYTKSYTNIMFLIENESFVLKLNSIENGETVIIKKYSPISEKENSYLNVIPKEVYKTIDDLLSSIMGLHFNKENFIKYYNRFIVPHSRETGIYINNFPLTIENFLKICDLDTEIYDVDSIIKNLISFEITVTDEIFNIVVEENVKSKLDLDTILLNNIIDTNIIKFTEYKKGKTNLLNMFFGEYLKALTNKNVDKRELINNIKTYMDAI